MALPKGNIPWNKGKIVRIKKTCITCNIIFEVIPSRKDKARYCSLKCQPPWNKGLKGIHLSPESEFKKGSKMWLRRKNSQTNNALEIWRKNGGVVWNKNLKGIRLSPNSEFKRGQYSGNKHWFWKGGITPLKKAIRMHVYYEEWRRKVFDRDNYTCQSCGGIGMILEVNHKKPFALIIHKNKIKTIDDAINCQELWDISNGETLCQPCHRVNETWGYKTHILIAERRDNS